MKIERICKNCENYGGEEFCLLHRYNLAKCGERKDDFFPSREVLERTGNSKQGNIKGYCGVNE